MGIIIKSETEIALMRQAGRIVASVLEILSKQVKPGMKTKELDVIAAREVERLGAKPSFKGYRGFPANLCVSVNDEIVHGIPGERVLREGDIVSLDLGTFFKGFQGDAAITVGVGEVEPEAKRLMETTEGALKAGMAAAHSQARLGDISAAIQSYAEEQSCSVVRDFVGHGVGFEFHESPQIPHFGQKGQGIRLIPGMVFTIEPMINLGNHELKILEDNWTAVTKDRSLSAQFEQTIWVTDSGFESLTPYDL